MFQKTMGIIQFVAFYITKTINKTRNVSYILPKCLILFKISVSICDLNGIIDYAFLFFHVKAGSKVLAHTLSHHMSKPQIHSMTSPNWRPILVFPPI